MDFRPCIPRGYLYTCKEFKFKIAKQNQLIHEMYFHAKVFQTETAN